MTGTRAVASGISLVRFRLWALLVRARLRRHDTRFHLEVARSARFTTPPRVRIRPRGTGGAVVVRIGAGVHLGSDLQLDLGTGSDIELDIGTGSELEHAVRIQALAGRIVVGPRNEIRDGAVLKVSHDGAELRLGERVKVGRGVAVHCHHSVQIDDLVTLAERVTVVDSYHDVDGSDRWTMEQPIGVGRVHLESNVMVLSGAVVLHSTTLGRNAVVAANSVVPSGVHAPGCVLLGVPARTVRVLPNTPSRDDQEIPDRG